MLFSADQKMSIGTVRGRVSMFGRVHDGSRGGRDTTPTQEGEHVPNAPPRPHRRGRDAASATSPRFYDHVSSVALATRNEPHMRCQREASANARRGPHTNGQSVAQTERRLEHPWRIHATEAARHCRDHLLGTTTCLPLCPSVKQRALGRLWHAKTKRPPTSCQRMATPRGQNRARSSNTHRTKEARRRAHLESQYQ